jgi:ACS family phthalate transporter-like MFS transporter
VAYFGVLCGANTIAFWAPTVIRRLGVEDVVVVGLLAAIPYLFALPVMYWVGHHSDRTLERRWHVAGCLLTAAVCFLLFAPLAGSSAVAIVLLAVAAAGVFGAMTVFWAIPPTYLTGGAAAGGIAFISSCGATGGFVSPTLIGWFAAQTGSIYTGVGLMGGIMIVGALVLVVGLPGRASEDASPA